MWEMRNAFEILVENPEGKIPLRRLSADWRMVAYHNEPLRNMDEGRGLDISDSGKGQVEGLNTVMNLRVP
jgi:hypothetical protein